MALFGKLFEKKSCSLCGGEIGLLGNRKLSDGNCCKKCASQLSPWFEDRRSSTVEQIRNQLAYRARNAAELNSFSASTVIGEYEKMYIETEAGVPTRFFVTSGSNYLEENPDIIPFANVMSCSMDIEEDREEILRKNAEGEEVSYNPPRYKNRYHFYIDMVIRDIPYFDSIRFRVNENDVELEQVRSGFSSGGFGRTPAYSREYARYEKYEQMCRQICQSVEDARNGAQAQEAAAAAAEAARPAFCPGCGAPSDGGKFCQFCGTKLG